jgi:SAM-dependent methyltransferase
MNQGNSPSDREIELNRIHVLNLAKGFFQSSVLFAMLKLKIFELIGEGSRTLSDLSKQLDVQSDVLARLLNAGVILKLLESKDSTNFKVASECRAVMLPSAGENYLGNFIKNLNYFQDALYRLDEAVMTSKPTLDPKSILGSDTEQTWEFTLAMHNNASLLGKELAKFLDTSSCSSVLDLGCGPGTYAFHLGLRNPELKLYLSDLPEVLEVAKEIKKRYHIENEVHYLPLDAIKDEIPGIYDMILVSNTLHMLGEQASCDLLKRLYKSINQGGSLVIQAQFLRDDHRGEQWPIYLDLILLCVSTEGRNHTVKETKRWLEEAGFVNVEYNPMSVFNANSYLQAYKK